MKKGDNIQEELTDIAPALGNAAKTTVYAVPPAYFNELAENVLQKIKQEEEADYQFSKTNPYTIPTGYFEQLPALILNQIKKDGKNEVHEELESLAPVLNKVDKKVTFTVPPGYFESLHVPVANLEEVTEAKVVKISWVRKMAKYAAAAIVTAITAISALLLIEGKQTKNQGQFTAKAEVKTLSEEEIEDFLGTTPAMEGGSAALYTEGQDKQIRQSLSQVSDNEIRQFLQEEYGEAEEI